MFDKVFAEHADPAEFFAVPEGLAQELQKASVLLRKNPIKDAMLAFGKGKGRK